MGDFILLLTLIISFCWWKQASWCIWTLHFHSPLPWVYPYPVPLHQNLEYQNSKIPKFQIAEMDFSSLRKLIDTFESVQKQTPETPNRHNVLYQGSTCWESFWRQGNVKNAEHGKLINSKNMKKSKSWFLVFTCLKRVTVLFLDSLGSRKPSQLNKSLKN